MLWPISMTQRPESGRVVDIATPDKEGTRRGVDASLSPPQREASQEVIVTPAQPARERTYF
jgi:hypothetical protein